MNSNQQSIEFYEKQISSLKYMLKEIELKGEDALIEIDRSRGVRFVKINLKKI